jgi:hypothetical protein
VDLKPGLRLQSQVSDTEIVVIKGSGDHHLTCGGSTLVALGDPAAGDASIDPGDEGSTLLGKRYTDPDDTIEVLCTKPGAGTLSLDGAELAIKQTKALPASD